eukprot:scaffold113678_cov15-Phaeocystis_antarctica.AAC.1
MARVGTVAGRHGGGDDRDEDPATDESVHGEVAVGEGAWLGVGVGVRVRVWVRVGVRFDAGVR